MANRQHFGIKYPFTTDGDEGFYVDANKTLKDKVRSLLMHVVFTPKGQRLRNPTFGTDLIKHIFDMGDSVSMDAVKTEVSDSVSRWVKNVTINDVKVVSSEDDPNEVYVRLDYSIKEGNKEVTDSIAVEL